MFWTLVRLTSPGQRPTSKRRAQAILSSAKAILEGHVQDGSGRHAFTYELAADSNLDRDLIAETALANLWRRGQNSRALRQQPRDDPAERREVQVNEVRRVYRSIVAKLETLGEADQMLMKSHLDSASWYSRHAVTPRPPSFSTHVGEKHQARRSSAATRSDGCRSS
jgi:hypothetical protein